MRLKLLFASALLSCSAFAHAADIRFDSHYFYQAENVLTAKGIKFDELARYSRNVQSKIWKALNKVKLPVSRGYLIIAFRADGAVATWLEMQPEVHEYYANEIDQAVKKVTPPPITDGTVVFAMKMSIDTPQHVPDHKPEAKDWAQARKHVPNPDDIEALVRAAWPEE